MSRSTAQKYSFIINHPHFYNEDDVSVELIIDPHDVCPITNRIESYAPLNTKTQYWLEFIQPYYDDENNKWSTCHNYVYDCGADSYEELIDKLYNMIIKSYGDYDEDEAHEKWLKVMGISKNSFNYMFKSTIPEESKSFHKNKVLSLDDRLNLKSELQELKDTLNALTWFRETCTIPDINEFNEHYQSIEHDIWQIEQSLLMGIDIDL